MVSAVCRHSLSGRQIFCGRDPKLRDLYDGHLEIGCGPRNGWSRLQTYHDLQVPVIPITLGVSPSIPDGTDGGRSSCAKGWIYASKVPIGSALRPRIHRASGGREAPSGNPRMAVAARASQYRALPCAGRAGGGTAERTRAPLFARTPLIGARGPHFGGTVPL